MDFKIKKPKYYVGVHTSRGLELVTKTEGSMWYADKDQKPKVFTKSLAEELVVCMAMNDTFAVVLYTQDHIDLLKQPFAKYNEEKENQHGNTN